MEYAPAKDAGTFLEAGEAAVLTVLDEASPIFGAAISIPRGATDKRLYVALQSIPGQLPNLPFEFTKVGEPVTIDPIGEVFNAAVTVSVPYTPHIIPSGISRSDLKVLAMSDTGWAELPAVPGDGHRLDVQISELFYDNFIVAAPKPIGENQVLILSEQAHASLYVDGVNTGKRAPAVIEVPSEGAQIKLYLEGFNELFSEITPSARGGIVRFELTRSQSNQQAPLLNLDQDLASLTRVTGIRLELSGTVSFGGAAQPDQIVIMSLNGKDSFQQTDAAGHFKTTAALQKGLNRLSLRTTGENGETFSTKTHEVFLD